MQEKERIERIKALSNANGASGFEDEVVQLVKGYTAGLGTQETDGIKNLYIARKENTGHQPVLQFDAHSDEVGMMIQAVKPNGTLRFITLGGWIAGNLTAQKVRVRNRAGKYITGIVSSKPPHFMTAEEKKKVPHIADMVIDVGAVSSEEADKVYGIDIGEPVVPDVEADYDEASGRFFGKAFDCRIGVACMADVLEELSGEVLACDIVSTLTSQEEVGERGGAVAAQKVQADLAVVFEGCPADDTGAEEYMIQTAMGKGPMLRHCDVSMITSPEFQQYALKIAEENNIPVQTSVRTGGGTNGAVINKVKGTPAIVVGIPVRYAHTPNCFAAYEDYLNAKKLVLAILRSLDSEKLKKLMKPLEGE